MSEKIIDEASRSQGTRPQVLTHFHYTTSGMPMEISPLPDQAPLSGFYMVELRLLGRAFAGMSYEPLERLYVSDSLAFRSGHENQPQDLARWSMKVLCIETGRVRVPHLRIALPIQSLEELSRLFAARKVAQ